MGVVTAVAISSLLGCDAPALPGRPPLRFLINALPPTDGPAGAAPSAGQAEPRRPDVAAAPASPADAPVARPADVASTAAPTAAPAPSGGSGGGSGGGGSSGGFIAPPETSGEVLDRQGQPIEGAKVLFTNGLSGTTDARGRYKVVGSVAGLACAVSAPGYATSTLVAGEVPATLHLARLPSADPAFPGDTATIRGKVTWPEAAPLGTLITYYDDLGSMARPVVTDAAGNFAITVDIRRAGRPNGMLVAQAETAAPASTKMIAVSATFATLSQGAEPVALTGVLADQTVAFAVGAAPAGLPDVRHQVEIGRGDLAPFTIQTAGATSGTYKLPAAGALGATVRITVEAANADRTARSVIGLDPYALPATPPAFLALPTLDVTPAARKVAWSVPTANTRVQLALAQAPRLGETYWEAWVEQGAEYAFTPAEWPTGASATARLVAFEGAGAAVRRVASASRLRLLPSGDWGEGFRSAEVLVPFVP